MQDLLPSQIGTPLAAVVAEQGSFQWPQRWAPGLHHMCPFVSSGGAFRALPRWKDSLLRPSQFIV